MNNSKKTSFFDDGRPKTSLCWIDGKIVDPQDSPQQATVSVFDHGLLYGDGVFEGIRYYSGKIFRLAAHLRRLRQSLTALAIEIDYSDDQLEDALNELLAAAKNLCGYDSAYVRLIVTRGPGSLGIDPRSCDKPSVIMIVAPLQLASDQQKQNGLKVMISSVRRMSANTLDPKIKSLNYLNNILARMQATAAGADEAIMLNAEGYVAEASTENIFLVKNNILITPAVSEGLLEGITRAEIIKLGIRLGYKVEQKRVSMSDLFEADEVFLTGTGAELLAVREIDGRMLRHCPGQIFTILQTQYRALVSD